MFPFDQALLPQLTTRKALILVDFQNDFLDPHGALPSTAAEGFVNRALQLVSEFRGKGDIIWIQSEFHHPVAASTESIIVSDGGRSATHTSPDEPPDQEAFLSLSDALCVKKSSWGAKMSPAVEAAVNRGDTILTKSHYSGFNGTHLLRALRAKMVMEVFLCGSLANIGVYATALDAAGHGMSITLVEDCCGYRVEQRQLKAVKNLIQLTGCEIASAEETIEALRATPAVTTAPQSTRPPGAKAALGSSSSRANEELHEKKSSDVTELVESVAGLCLDADRRDIDKVAARSEDDLVPEEKKIDERGKMEKGDSPEKLDPHEATMSKDGGQGLPKVNDNDRCTKKPEDASTQAVQATNEATSTPPQGHLETGKAQDSSSQSRLCEGDTDIIGALLSEDFAKSAFDELRKEVQWQRMLHQGGEVPRLVAVQGEVAKDGSMPVYRHPSDQSPPLLPFSPTVLSIKTETERHLGHELNHVLIQYYRDGQDYISEHSDKTIDVVAGSYIANVSLGAERVMVFRTKRRDKVPSQGSGSPRPENLKRQSQRVRLPHNSLCRMGLLTNMKWLHSIRQDKRADREKTVAELAYKGGRISLTFRQIGTFLDRDEKIIWGQGAVGKTRAAAKPVINGQCPEAVKMLKAFGAENNSSDFDWEAWYGEGFDVLHTSSSPRLFASADAIVNTRIRLVLAEHGVNYAKGSMAPSLSAEARLDPKGSAKLEVLPVRFVDNDDNRSVVDGDIAIMLYLDAVYGHGTASRGSPADLALRLSHFQRALRLSDLWKRRGTGAEPTEALQRELIYWNDYARGDGFIDGSSRPTNIVDYALWPVLHALVKQHGVAGIYGKLKHLALYYESFAERKSTKFVVSEWLDYEQE